jgi:hydrogenase maturation protease
METTMLLVLGLGNRLLGDDAAGPIVIEQFVQRHGECPGVSWRDGGTLGLSLLPEIEDADALVVVDAARFGAAPGTVQVFEGLDMDEQLGGRKQSAHELALADLMGAAALGGRLPPRRALVAVEPASTALGLEPTPAVAAALPALVAAVEALVARWAPGRTNASDAALALQEVAHEA